MSAESDESDKKDPAPAGGISSISTVMVNGKLIEVRLLGGNHNRPPPVLYPTDPELPRWPYHRAFGVETPTPPFLDKGWSDVDLVRALRSAYVGYVKKFWPEAAAKAGWRLSTYLTQVTPRSKGFAEELSCAKVLLAGSRLISAPAWVAFMGWHWKEKGAGAGGKMMPSRYVFNSATAAKLRRWASEEGAALVSPKLRSDERMVRLYCRWQSLGRHIELIPPGDPRRKKLVELAFPRGFRVETDEAFEDVAAQTAALHAEVDVLGGWPWGC